jgi:DNA-binding FrmR family transcriptional regulator
MPGEPSCPHCQAHEAHHAPSHAAQLDALARIEGQVRGIRRMIEEGRYCVDILTQARAVHAALRQVERRILASHLESCVHDAFHHGTGQDRAEKMDEILSLFDWEAGRSGR